MESMDTEALESGELLARRDPRSLPGETVLIDGVTAVATPWNEGLGMVGLQF